MTRRDIFVKALVKRTAALRESKGISQSVMAAYMHVSRNVWSKYESRSPLPHHLIPLFCETVGCEIDYFLTGRTRRAPSEPASTVTEFRPRRTGTS